MFTNLEVLRTPSFWVFMKASLPRYDWLTHQPLADWFNLQPLFPSLPRSQGGEAKSLVFPPHPLPLVSKSHLTNITKDTLHYSYHSVKFKGFKSSVPETGSKTKYIFLIINHRITHIQSTRAAVWPALLTATFSCFWDFTLIVLSQPSLHFASLQVLGIYQQLSLRGKKKKENVEGCWVNAIIYNACLVKEWKKMPPK